jgi:transposase InsO family protein
MAIGRAAVQSPPPGLERLTNASRSARCSGLLLRVKGLLMRRSSTQRDLAFWIEGYYNRERRHSTIGYLRRTFVDEQQSVSTPKLTPVQP